MDFEGCKNCTHGQAENSVCECASTHEYYSEQELNQIFFRRGTGCHFFTELK